MALIGLEIFKLKEFVRHGFDWKEGCEKSINPKNIVLKLIRDPRCLTQFLLSEI